MERYEQPYSLPHQLIGEVTNGQIQELFESGWRWNPGDQFWVKVFWAIEGATETPAFLVQIILDLQARNLLGEGPYPGSVSPTGDLAGAAAVVPAVATPDGSPWGTVQAILAESFNEPVDFGLTTDTHFHDVVHAAAAHGFGLWLDWKEDFELQQRCRDLYDWRVGWSNSDFMNREQLSFVWDDQGQGGNVDIGLHAFDQYLQARNSGKRLVEVDTGADFYASFIVPAEHIDRLIAAFSQAGVSAHLQRERGQADAMAAGESVALVAGAPAAAPVEQQAPTRVRGQSPATASLPNVQLRFERMPLGQAGAAEPMTSVAMNVGVSAMPARRFSHEVGVIFVADGEIVDSEQLAAFGLDEDGLLHLAIANMAALIPALEVVRAPGITMLAGLGGLEACMALVPQVWDDLLAGEFPNGPVISIPAKDILTVCDRKDVAGIEGLRRGKQVLVEQSPDVLLAHDLYERRADGQWVVFDEGGAN